MKAISAPDFVVSLNLPAGNSDGWVVGVATEEFWTPAVGAFWAGGLDEHPASARSTRAQGSCRFKFHLEY